MTRSGNAPRSRSMVLCVYNRTLNTIGGSRAQPFRDRGRTICPVARLASGTEGRAHLFVATPRKTERAPFRHMHRLPTGIDQTPIAVQRPPIVVRKPRSPLSFGYVLTFGPAWMRARVDAILAPYLTSRARK
jgi:hypothetical protein